MNFLFHIEGSGFGGNERILLSLFPHLRKCGHAVYLSMEHATVLNQFADAVDGIVVGNDPASVLISFQIHHFVGVHGKIFDWARAALTLGLETSWLVGHPISLSQRPEELGTLGLLLFNRILLQSYFLKTDIEDLVRKLGGANTPLPQLEVIHSGVNTEKFFATGSTDAQSVRNLLGIPKDSIVLGSASRWAEYKNLPLLLEVFLEVHETLPETHLLLLIPRQEQERQLAWRDLWSRIKKMGLEGSVHFLSTESSEMRGFLTAMDIYISCAVGEGLGCSILEAMACRVPVIAHDSGGVSEILREGRGGVLLRDLDRNEYVKAILRVLSLNEEERVDLGREALERVKKDFSEMAMLQKYEAILTGGLQ